MKLHRTSIWSTLLLFSTMILLSSCTLNEGEPRVTLCKAVVKQLLGNPEVDWKEESTTTVEASAIQIRLLLDVNDKTETGSHIDTLTAACIYSHTPHSEMDEHDFADDEFDSSPSDVFINEKIVDHWTLTKAVNSVMGHAIKDTFNKVKDNLKQDNE